MGILNYILHYQVDKDHYQSQLRNKSLAMLTASHYRTDLDLEEDELMRKASGSSTPYVNSEQRDREMRGKLKADEAISLKFLEREAKKDGEVKLTLGRILGNREKVALIQSIVATKDLLITRHKNGNMLDIFLSGVYVLNKLCARALLRMLYMLPLLPCVKVLRQNLLLFAELSPETDNMRQLEWNWVWKLLGLIHSLGNTKTISSQNMIYNLTMLKKDTGVGYYFGNPLIHLLVIDMEACSLAREKALTGTEYTVAIRDFMQELTARSLTAMKKVDKAKEQTPAIEETGESEQDEPEDVPILTLPGTDKGYVLHGGHVDVVVPPHTPAKVWEGKSPFWTNSMKLELLRLVSDFISHQVYVTKTFLSSGFGVQRLKTPQRGLISLVEKLAIKARWRH